MDFGEMLRVVLRRWYVSVPVLLLTIVATVGMYRVWPTTYQSQIQLTLLDSRNVASQQGNAGNPYLDFNPSLDAVVDLMGRNLSSDQSASQLKALGMTNPYTAGIAQNAQGPFLAIVVTGHSPAKIIQAMPIIVTFARQRLAEMQKASAAPANSLIQLIPIAPASSPTKVLKTKFEIVAGVAILGLLCAFLLTFISDNVLNQRAARKQHADTVPRARAEPLASDRHTGEPRPKPERSWGPTLR